MKYIRFILFFPISFLYWLVTFVRNLFYDLGLIKSNKFSVKIISIGNLSAGGTGKTPVVEYITELLLKKHKLVAILSRGYKRKTKGYVLATADSSASDIGDEPFQFKKKFKTVQVAVCEKRVEGINNLMNGQYPPEIIILDDAYQHRSVIPGLNILLTEYSSPFFSDWILPSGNLREAGFNKKRSDMIVVTKCPDKISEEKIIWFKKRINPDKNQSLYFSGFEYLNLKSFSEISSEDIDYNNLSDYSVLLFTGIVNPNPLIEFLRPRVNELFSMKFADHYTYQNKDFGKIMQRFNEILNEKKIVITTEKDISRIEKTILEKDFKKIPFYYVPIQVRFIKLPEDTGFDTKIIDYAESD
jgi:tetraacyldisaccharide 4'-kinase